MATNNFWEKMQAGEICLGLGIMYPAAGIIEGMCAGWDFVWIDGQHGQLSYDSCLAAVHAAGAAGLDTVLRVPGHEYGIIGPLHDLAPSALMIPMVNSAEDAKRVVEATQFHPLGKRSYGGRRVIDCHGREYVRERKTVIIAQIETLEAMERVEEIVQTEGVDMVFFGPDDAKVQMGLAMDTKVHEHETMRAAMAETAQAARRAGKFAGTVAGTADAVRVAVDQGYSCLVGGSDIGFLRTSAEAKLAELRAFGTVRPAAGGSEGVYGN